MKFNLDITPKELFYKLQQYNNEIRSYAADMDIDGLNTYITDSEIESCLDSPIYQSVIATSRITEPVITFNGYQSVYQYQNLPEDGLIRNSAIAEDINHFQKQLNDISLITLDNYLKKKSTWVSEYHTKEVLKTIQRPIRELDDDEIEEIIDYRIDLMDDYTEKLNQFLNLKIQNLHVEYKTRTDLCKVEELLKDIRMSIDSLIRTRERLFLRLNFQILDEGIRDSKKYPSTLNERLANARTLTEQFQILKDADSQLYKVLKEQNKTFLDMRNYYLIDNNPNGNKRRKTNILFRNYLDGKGIDRGNYDKFRNGKYIKSKLFFYEMAMFLGLPTSDTVRKFLELNGIGIDPVNPLLSTTYITKSGIKKPINFFERDILRWLDCGVDTNTINSMMGLQLEKKVDYKKKGE